MDVLKVLDEVAHFHDNGSEAFDSLREARTSVAELIEAAECMDSSAYRGPDRDRLHAALSRIRGE